MHIISYNCIVHSRTSFEQFKKAIDEIRQKQTIPISVLLKLEKQCCTCGQQESKIHFDETKKANLRDILFQRSTSRY